MATAAEQSGGLPWGRAVLSWATRSPWPVYVAGLAPAALYFYWGAVNRLGADPIRAFEHVLGLWALRFLILTLLVTPLRHVTGFNLVRYRRALGLLAFYYAAMHFLVYMALDKAFDMKIVLEDIVKRPFITIGMAALVFLLPLALTSSNYAIRRMGQGWTRLHRLVYPIAALAATHFILSVKSWPVEPLVYAGIVAALLAFRLLRRFVPKARPRPRRS